MLDFSKEYLVINYITMDNVNSQIKLTTTFEFSIMCRHFLIQEQDFPIDLEEPYYELLPDTGYCIHETAINRIK
jgi:hypothetical protein